MARRVWLKHMAVLALVDCFGAAEADGFQQHETEEWVKAGVQLVRSGPEGMTLLVDGVEINVLASMASRPPTKEGDL